MMKPDMPGWWYGPNGEMLHVFTDAQGDLCFKTPGGGIAIAFRAGEDCERVPSRDEVMALRSQVTNARTSLDDAHQNALALVAAITDTLGHVSSLEHRHNEATLHATKRLTARLERS